MRICTSTLMSFFEYTWKYVLQYVDIRILAMKEYHPRKKKKKISIIWIPFLLHLSWYSLLFVGCPFFTFFTFLALPYFSEVFLTSKWCSFSWSQLCSLISTDTEISKLLTLLAYQLLTMNGKIIEKDCHLYVVGVYMCCNLFFSLIYHFFLVTHFCNVVQCGYWK